MNHWSVDPEDVKDIVDVIDTDNGGNCSTAPKVSTKCTAIRLNLWFKVLFFFFGGLLVYGLRPK